MIKQGENDVWHIEDEKSSFKESSWGVRHVQALLMFVCLTIGYGMRVTMSVGVVAMTDKNTPKEKGVMIFDWDKKTQDYILSSFFWGYACMQLPAGHLAHKYGAKYLLVFALTFNGVIAILIPWAGSIGGSKAIMACRILQGLSQGSFLPSLHTLQGKWAPIKERSRMHNYVYGGSHFGTIVVMPLSGFLAASSYGWPFIFYTFGCISLFWGGIWCWFGAESPATHKTISEGEKDYIQDSLGQKDQKKAIKIPWKKLLSSWPVWAIAVAHIGSSWVHVTLFTEIPSYLNKVMRIDMKSNGLLSALPFLGMWICGFFFSYFSDYFINKRICSLTNARKICNTIGKWGGALGFVILGFVPKDKIYFAVAMLVIIASLKSATFIGFHVNHIDLSPNFAGTLISITNTVSNCIATMAPITAGYVLKDDNDPVQWRIVFCITAAILFLTNLLYIIFGSAEKMPWNEPDYILAKTEDAPTIDCQLDEKNNFKYEDENRENYVPNKK